MASSPMPSPGGPPSGGPSGASPSSGASGGGSGSPAILQMVAMGSRLFDQLAQTFPAAKEETDQIQSLIQQIQVKAAQSAQPSQPQAPPV